MNPLRVRSWSHLPCEVLLRDGLDGCIDGPSRDGLVRCWWNPACRRYRGNSEPQRFAESGAQLRRQLSNSIFLLKTGTNRRRLTGEISPLQSQTLNPFFKTVHGSRVIGVFGRNVAVGSLK
jgi:hypothetical protein